MAAASSTRGTTSGLGSFMFSRGAARLLEVELLKERFEVVQAGEMMIT